MQEKLEGGIKVENYGLAEFLKEVQPLLKSGYVFDFTENDNYPQSYGAFYSCVLVEDTKEKKTRSVVKS